MALHYGFREGPKGDKNSPAYMNHVLAHCHSKIAISANHTFFFSGYRGSILKFLLREDYRICYFESASSDHVCMSWGHRLVSEKPGLGKAGAVTAPLAVLPVGVEVAHHLMETTAHVAEMVTGPLVGRVEAPGVVGRWVERRAKEPLEIELTSHAPPKDHVERLPVLVLFCELAGYIRDLS